eukprot:GHVL01009948.1.p1 GENE.GHVL01009948.1~~GHVL01009948.1.p1  ORF type:complete len:129 (+),score=22.26 GHVL01009948.1:173-559(+)
MDRLSESIGDTMFSKVHFPCLVMEDSDDSSYRSENRSRIRAERIMNRQCTPARTKKNSDDDSSKLSVSFSSNGHDENYDICSPHISKERGEKIRNRLNTPKIVPRDMSDSDTCNVQMLDDNDIPSPRL